MAPPAGGIEDRRAREMRAGESLKGRYRLLRHIAAGPGTEVWTARDEILDRTVLVKLLHVTAGDIATRERFRREALGVARLSHPGIVAVYDTILEGGATGLVLEHVQATPLSRFLHEGGSMSPDEAVSIGLQVADALEAAHNNGVRHGNLSSDSVWLCSDQRVKITDFGTSWEPNQAGEGDPPTTAAEGVQVDIGALGRLVEECLTADTPPGRLPDTLADFVADTRGTGRRTSSRLVRGGARPPCGCSRPPWRIRRLVGAPGDRAPGLRRRRPRPPAGGRSSPPSTGPCPGARRRRGGRCNRGHRRVSDRGRRVPSRRGPTERPTLRAHPRAFFARRHGESRRRPAPQAPQAPPRGMVTPVEATRHATTPKPAR